MSGHVSNIKAFVEAANSTSDPIVKAYFGLVAIELVLKEATGLKDHNVPAALNKFAHLYAVGTLAGCKIRVNSLSAQLQNELVKVIVNDAESVVRPTPTASYPYLRYARYHADGWPDPTTLPSDATKLAATVEQIRAYLREKFNKSL